MRASYSLVLVLLLYLDSLTLVTLAASNNPHLCRCTCFVTNTTILPLFSPLDPHNPCSTCTRQFCLSQGLEACRGARIERPDADTGTGWEGEVWAKCLRPDSERDKTILSLYVITVVALLAFATFKDRVQSILGRVHSQGPSAVYRSVVSSPWVRQVNSSRS